MLIWASCGKENPDGFAFCGYCTAPLAEQPSPAALEERKIVSVLFCDLVGFTAASEQQDPESPAAGDRGLRRRTARRHGLFVGSQRGRCLASNAARESARPVSAQQMLMARASRQ